MKDYRSIFETQRRRADFSKHFTQSFENAEVAKLLSIKYDGVKWLPVLDNPNALKFLCQQLPYIYSAHRVLALSSYVHLYYLIECLIRSNVDGEEIKALTQAISNDAQMTSVEIFEFLHKLLPSYAEALFSFIDDAGIDVRERLLDAFRDGDKQTFTTILQKEHCDTYRFSQVCELIREKYAYTELSALVRKVRFIEENETDIRELPLDEIKDGHLAKVVLEVKDFDDSDEEQCKLLESDARVYYKYGVKVFFEAGEMLSDEQKRQYQDLLLAEDIAQWYDAIHNEVIIEQQYVQPESEERPEQEMLELPVDFLSSPKYIDTKVPAIPGFKLPCSNNKQLIQLIELLTTHNCIGNDTESKYKFIRAFTGRSVNHKDIFEKAYWRGTCLELLYLVKYFAPGAQKKYQLLPQLFLLNPNEDKILQERLNAPKDISAYANRGGQALSQELVKLFPSSYK